MDHVRPRGRRPGVILYSDPKAQYLARRTEIDAAIAAVLDEGWYILGKQVSAFEQAFADYLGVKHAIGVGSGTDALHLALRALDIGPGDEVITVSHTAVATAAAIEIAGATPVLVDIEPDYYTLDPSQLEAVLTPRTRAVLPVHLYGQPAEMDPILAFARRHGLEVVEDCAQAHGARYRGRRVGGLGDAGCFSFYPTKNLGAIGDGGAIVTDDDKVADRLKQLREYGWDNRRNSRRPGWNSRLDELQAAILNVKLPHLEADNRRRRAVALIYDEALSPLPLALPRRRDDCDHAYRLYVVACDDRDALSAHLRSRDIVAGIHYALPVHRQSAYAGRLAGAMDLPVTDKAVASVLSLPIFPELQEAQATSIVDAVRSFYDAQAASQSM